LQTTLDSFKLTLGLPPEVEVRIDDSTLDRFELNDPRLDNLRTRTDALYQEIVQYVGIGSMPRPELADGARRIIAALDELEAVHDEALQELQRWLAQIAEIEKAGFEGPDSEHRREVYEREKSLSGEIQEVLVETDTLIDENQKAAAEFLAELANADLDQATIQLRDLIGKGFRARLSEVFVAQTQIRVFLIDLQKIDLTVNQAIQVAIGNRLDLQNTLAQVTDAWRNVEVAANALRGFLNFEYTGNLQSAPDHQTLFRFDASNSTHRFGLEFDAPINRRVERNAYRAAQITYQRARRAYMAQRDEVVRQIRLDMRQLVLNRRQFEINREQLITASRQLEEAEYQLRNSTENQPVTLNLINALTAVLQARNSLINTWVSYETARMTLYRDFDLMDIDSMGMWINENDPTAVEFALKRAIEHPAPSLAIPAGIPDLSPNAESDSTFYVDIEPGGEPAPLPDRLDETEGPLEAPDLPAGTDANGGQLEPNGAVPAAPRPIAPPTGAPGPFEPPTGGPTIP
jgi:hypothetical protein